MKKEIKKNYRIGIIAALQQEVQILFNKLKNYKINKISNITFYIGNIHNIHVVLAKSGVGKVFSGITCALLLQKYKVKFIINIGSAGSLNKNLKPGSIIIPTNVCYHDVNLTAFGYSIGQIKNCPKTFLSNTLMLKLTEKYLFENKIKYQKKLMISGDIFIDTCEKKSLLKKRFPKAIAVDMEAAAIAHVCYQFNIPILIIKSISDSSDINAADNFKYFINLASKNSSLVTINVLQTLFKNTKNILFDNNNRC
ncbi:5'-methylthioadenosine/S-adenosylhomocysteine nucleosidase [Buchnera aphidicola str. Bp (Baizongia pistaciae)]|uniref:5'-methylthioadenosine/S-adenosylhomocysteine nucleosidase n=1 Tax=Buchnera aphidicola subsp. Baizongia pistaciae (strain Bp) TaxID=224915 RepID=MTNN_BUCBP|nr:5'-methylthioadenosine/adenosylhomocysteine nucleosidase [Buchnera aphidicola]Q89AQ7.1 RecName: Full=5'-methylthioadenosine/S-adenosylhomocysteine nucleosidase; Short=MTA/SAH nucleosidase; Short=MTAN; AltName: Full=5'-deoxyadenosine nucleosidase; Short=DOA nucleosidase; Short=dAdo nucleosidase; AltName: Full=5'-methylthioadenosine nucleosidase; Short=MTA nucleosidase; AltName: Full=S-adenosylhomocysteine nucleosidase; Short=AdoHcy nucleosidase; Short=SAH nucleosidase; Short=SRH nucleosidase [Bu